MSLVFTKMHGLGNDFIILDFRQEYFSLTKEQIRLLCDRHLGVGCDQLVTLHPPLIKDAHIFVRFFNPDGSEAGACGNASRCVASLLPPNAILQTQHGILKTSQTHDPQKGTLINVNMGKPLLEWHEIPLSSACDTLSIAVGNGRYHGAGCSIGNPHITLFHALEDAAILGSLIENDPIFSQKANVGFAEILSRTEIKLRVWERGAGLTLACGSGACAALVNAVRHNLTERSCTIIMDRGKLHITWQEDGTLLMSGPTTKIFQAKLEEGFL